MDTLVTSRAAVIQTSSVGARLAPSLDLNDLNFDRKYSPIRAYCAAKLENILFTVELARRYGPMGISAAAFHPGNVATSFGSQTESALMRFGTTNPISRRLLLTTPDKGADQLVWLAETSAGTAWASGTYYEKRRPTKRMNAQVHDPVLAHFLWDKSWKLVHG